MLKKQLCYAIGVKCQTQGTVSMDKGLTEHNLKESLSWTHCQGNLNTSSTEHHQRNKY